MIINEGRRPKVSVTLLTYNHGEWLRHCLESIVSQKTDFDFEVIVGDDAPTDQTSREILRYYSKKYPEIIIPILRESNLGPSRNYFDVVGRARGQYIAYIDGDDLMFPGKLQRQADLLDSHPDVAIVAHQMLTFTCEPPVGRRPFGGKYWIGKTETLFTEGCFFCHSSKMYRRSAIVTTSSVRPIVDYYLHIEHSMSGKIIMLKDCYGAYRRAGSGITQRPEFQDQIIQAYDDAFDRAKELGVLASVVEQGRIRHSQAQGLVALRTRNFDAFMRLARIPPKNRKYASLRQLVINLLADFPRTAGAIQSFMVALKNVGRQ